MSLTHFYPYPIMDDSPRKTFHFSTDHHRQPPPSISTLTRTTTDQLSKEPMFEKPLTPSDVGKLNRLVIPKQHAEKYIPRADSAADQQKGLLLSFEDETGKPWRFRYSYWNSSQSYVLTKGWSRYVKEKHLDAGDVVLFERHSDRFFIGWRRKAVAAVPVQDSVAVASAQINGSTTRLFHDAQYYYPSHLPHPYQPHCLHAGGINDIVESSQRDMVGGSRNPRRVRLFGVNLECPDDSEPSTPDGSSQGTSGQTHYQYYSNSNNMDINFRYHQHQG